MLLLSFVITTVFTVSLTENLQLADGLLASSTKLIYEMDIGETKMITWAITNNEEDAMTLEFYATGPGSELLVFEEYMDLDSHTRKEVEIFVIIPDDHPNNIEFHPELFALKRASSLEEGESGFFVNLQMRTIPVIKIGDNPVYTPPTPIQVEEVKEKITKEQTQDPLVVEETLEEKLARIQAANEKTEKPKQLDEDDVYSQPQDDEDYIPEPIPDPEPTVKITDIDPNLKECNFIDVFLSWFGLSKC